MKMTNERKREGRYPVSGRYQYGQQRALRAYLLYGSGAKCLEPKRAGVMRYLDNIRHIGCRRLLCLILVRAILNSPAIMQKPKAMRRIDTLSQITVSHEEYHRRSQG